MNKNYSNVSQNNNSNPNLLVFTDLDGTLLDYNNYSFDLAQPAIDLLRSQQIPMIPATSKSIKEMLIINATLNNQHPFIAEDGSLICIPNGYFDKVPPTTAIGSYQLLKLAPNYAEVISVLQSLRELENFSFIGFNDMTVDAIANITGLTQAQAKNAKG